MAKKITKEQQIEQEQNYVSFLQKRLQSTNYKNNVSKEEYGLEKKKYDKAKLKLKFLTDK